MRPPASAAALAWRVFADQVREGWMRPRSWPPGLRPAGWFAAGALALVLVMAATAGWLRAHTPLERASAQLVLPSVGLVGLTAITLVVMTLIAQATLRGHWALRVGLLLVLAAPLGLGLGIGVLGLVGLVPLAALVGLGLWRARRPVALWELPACALLVAGSWSAQQLVLAAQTRGAIDYSGLVLLSAIIQLAVVSFPVLVVAGFGVTEIAVTALSGLVQAGVRRSSARQQGIAFVALLLLALGGLALPVLRGESGLDAVSLGVSAAVLAVAGVAAAVLDRVARRAPSPRPAPTMPDAAVDEWKAWVWIAGVALVSPLLVSAVVDVLGGPLKWLPAAAMVDRAWARAIASGVPVMVARAGLAVAALAMALVRARRGDRTLPAPLVVLALLTILSRVPALGDDTWLPRTTPAALVALSLAASMVVAVVVGARGQLTRPAGMGVVAAVAMCALWPLREALDDPLSAVLGSASLVTALVGLVWFAVADGEWTLGDTERLPRTTRVLLHLAVVVLGGLVLLLAVLGRSAVGPADPSRWANLGDSLLGTPLFVAIIFASLTSSLVSSRSEHRAAFPGDPARVSQTGAQPSTIR